MTTERESLDAARQPLPDHPLYDAPASDFTQDRRDVLADRVRLDELRRFPRRKRCAVTDSPSLLAVRDEIRFRRERGTTPRAEDVDWLLAQDALTASLLTEVRGYLLACVGDAEGLEAVKRHRMLTLTAGQVQCLNEALFLVEGELGIELPDA